MLNEGAKLQIQGSCNYNGGKLDDENRRLKNQKRRFDFFGRNFCDPTTHTLPSPLHRNHRKTLDG